jgi:hypothetical protein
MSAARALQLTDVPGGALRPGDVVPGQLREGKLLQTVVQDAGDGPGSVRRRSGDLVDQRGDVVPGELRGAQPLLQGLAGVLTLVPALDPARSSYHSSIDLLRRYRGGLQISKSKLCPSAHGRRPEPSRSSSPLRTPVMNARHSSGSVPVDRPPAPILGGPYQNHAVASLALATFTAPAPQGAALAPVPKGRHPAIVDLSDRI